jgi:hypothetical protein
MLYLHRAGVNTAHSPPAPQRRIDNGAFRDGDDATAEERNQSAKCGPPAEQSSS